MSHDLSKHKQFQTIVVYLSIRIPNCSSPSKPCLRVGFKSPSYKLTHSIVYWLLVENENSKGGPLTHVSSFILSYNLVSFLTRNISSPSDNIRSWKVIASCILTIEAYNWTSCAIFPHLCTCCATPIVQATMNSFVLRNLLGKEGILFRKWLVMSAYTLALGMNMRSCGMFFTPFRYFTTNFNPHPLSPP